MNPNQIIKKATALAITIYAHQTAKWLREINKLEKFDPGFTLSPLHQNFQKLTQKVILLTWLTGIQEAKKEIKKTADYRDGIITKNVWETVGFDDALKKLAKKKIVSPQTYKDMESKSKSIAWSIQRIENQNALLAAKIHMKNVIDTGMDLRYFKETMAGVYKSYGITPLSPHHLETVYRTNLGSVYNASKFETYQKNDNIELLQYIGVEDHRLEDICRPFINQVYRKDDPIWNIIGPLNHYQCRCGITGYSKESAKEYGIKASKKPAAGHLKKVHADFNNTPRTIKKYKADLEKVVKRKVKANTRITKEIKQGFTPAKSIKEAEEWARKNGIAEIVDWKGVKESSIEMVNQIHKTLWENQKEFPEIKDSFQFLGTIQNRNKQIRKIIKERILEDIQKGKYDDYISLENGDINKATGKIVNSLLSRYGARRINKHTWAEATYLRKNKAAGITINKMWLENESRFIEKLKYNVDVRYHPQKCDTIKSLVDHEIGHILDNVKKITESHTYQELLEKYYGDYKTMVKGLSKYATTNKKEFLAEAWAEYRNNPNPREIARAVGEYIMNVYQKGGQK